MKYLMLVQHHESSSEIPLTATVPALAMKDQADLPEIIKSRKSFSGVYLTKQFIFSRKLFDIILIFYFFTSIENS